MIRKTRIQAFQDRYRIRPSDPAEILSSIAKVARAGRTGDPDRIEQERKRHYRLMASLGYL
jgi:hypothetical protein